ncbi:transmembrane protein 134-like [Strongylocentrotus purpuratus]|uniref:Transmembrane protein 230 n=1 Tax=Strongylocentrotus purpuratus TaxID=7668 RepID=A0A7M7T255_STRPU|nr:transmembrane protein 134-like [Strongylocentrotus purpuratus]|eukprot:XP_011675384.1 PREDICTED: transmembrane protein 134-like [Strongylocentrotus purpuratus]
MSTPLIDPSAHGSTAGTFEVTEGDPNSNADKPGTWWFLKAELKEYRNSLLVSFILLLTGSALLLIGIVLEIGVKDHAAGTVCIVAGVLMFIPGLYYTGYAFFATKGYQGFDLSNLKYFRLSK